ncbi:MAG: hypothetical protein L6Q94_07560 [Calditrichia bacterium]|nr:hypothetical protein [Calditrichia bacterium]
MTNASQNFPSWEGIKGWVPPSKEDTGGCKEGESRSRKKRNHTNETTIALYVLSIFNRQSSIINHQSSIINHQSSIINRLPPVDFVDFQSSILQSSILQSSIL